MKDTNMAFMNMNKMESKRRNIELLGMLLVLLVELSSVISKSSECSFPKQWRGRWHQRAFGELTINSNNISGKGKCVEHQRGYYLLQDKKGECYSCLIIFERHRNIIQYRETPCLKKKSNFWQFVKLLVPELPLYTLIRDKARSVPCPFHGAYHLGFNNNTRGFCQHPRSYVQPCAGDAVYHFRFQACPQIPDTFDMDLELECLASWKVGSDKFLYGRFSGNAILNKDNRHRCFMYQDVNSDIQMSMSADSSCQGLRTPVDGPLTIQLQSDEHGWTEPGCEFPDYIKHHTWRDISGKHHFYVNEGGTSLEAVHQKSNKKGRVTISYQCLTTFPNDPEVFQATSLTSHGCTSHYQCISIRVLSTGVIAVNQGKIQNYPPNYCGQHDQNETSLLLIDELITPTPCPFQGGYTASNIDPLVPEICTRHLEFGCNGTSVLSAKQTCVTNAEASMKCVTHWTAEDRRYLIVKDLAYQDDEEKGAAPMRCMAIKETSNGVHIINDDMCVTHSNTKHTLDYFSEKSLQFDGYCGENQASYRAESSSASAFKGTFHSLIIFIAVHIYCVIQNSIRRLGR